MYLLKSFTLEDSNLSTTCTFNLFIKEGKPILVESVLESNGSKAVNTSAGYEEVSERLWTFINMCNDAPKVAKAFYDFQRLIVEERYGSK